MRHAPKYKNISGLSDKLYTTTGPLNNNAPDFEAFKQTCAGPGVTSRRVGGATAHLGLKAHASGPFCLKV